MITKVRKLLSAYTDASILSDSEVEELFEELYL